ncbi:ribonuclease T2-like [Tulasnella sp. 424]|nr:ribonuclease T2-like [Tulasnella sp. 424]
MIKFTPFLACALLARVTFAIPAPLTSLARAAGDTCPANVVSCQNGSAGVDSCCVETPGGQLVQTQFWDFNPSTGPSDSWTVHGLWPDHCDGTFDEGCDPSRNYPSITDVLTENGKEDLLQFMNEFWVDINGKNEQFWSHEWNTHGTCMSTIAPSCMPEGSKTGLDAAFYFQKAVDTFKSLGTYDFLSSAGIEPDKTKTHTLAELTSAVKEAHGFIPAFDCKKGSLNAVYYYFNLQGTVMDGTLVPIDAPKGGSCPKTGIKYLPKAN